MWGLATPMLMVRLCRRRGAFRRSAVCLLCVLGAYCLLSVALRSEKGITVYQHLAPLEDGHSSMRPQGVGEPKAPLSMVTSRLPAEATAPRFADTQPSVRVDTRVLLVYDKESTKVAKAIRIILQSHRVEHTFFFQGESSLPQLVSTEDGVVAKYSLVICADMAFLHGKWPRPVREHYINYTRNFKISIIHFTLPQSLGELTDFTTVNITANETVGVSLNQSRQFYYLKTGEWFTDIRWNGSWVGFIPAESAVYIEVLSYIKYLRGHGSEHTTPLSLITKGRGLEEVLIGSPLGFWMTKVLLLELLRTYTPSSLRFGRKRWVMIDIDDIFVAPEGLKMTPEDVQVQLVTGGIQGYTFPVVGPIASPRPFK